ncbi:MAG: hypothetical protein KatS3mg090_0829 [Patescibacteria group bacterium]|nr:MAG: hypothetical protein KatS3mg090_0829 [Patescibacteria group bacterium]
MVEKNNYFRSTLINNNIFTAFVLKKRLSFKNKDLTATAEKIKDFVSKQTGVLKSKLKIVFMGQTHSTNINFLNNSDDLNSEFTILPDTDAVVTNLVNTVLVIKTADCLPVLYTADKFIAVSHQGWLGSLANFAEKMILKLQLLGAKLDDIKISIGPHIADCCYSIDSDRASLFKLVYSNWQDLILRKFNKTFYLNLLRLNLLQYQKAGLNKNQIDYRLFCTSCDKRFCSYRRDKALNQQNLSLILKL